ncbi:Protein SMG7 [Portunus trituberculatus]|uniref:Protein SMG7 n=1 Tax=Portunus trituberculatus TaxID=210409 RepID=A0A5B7GQE8_PORTR|nr:Protein SMG7 [Portunus trituberculatus]
MDALFCYTVMQKEFSKKKRQTTMRQFFKKTPVEDVVPEEDVDDPVEAVEAEEAQVDDDVLDLEVDSDGLLGGGSNEARDLLGWFLNSASGFYLQLFNQICSEYGLDLPFRRKDSIYGVVDLNVSTQTKSKASSQKNALYICQYCLVHLGDLARYRHQAKQAETYYRHAVMVAPTSGHPYNQLALLEAGRGNRLAAVALYVRAIRNNDVSASSRVTGEEYTNLFLQCHARLYLHADVVHAQEALPTLSSALSTLVATNAFTRTSLIQVCRYFLFFIYLAFHDSKLLLKSKEIGLGTVIPRDMINPTYDFFDI